MSAADDATLATIRERFDIAIDAWRTIRDEGTTDMRYVAGDPWTTKDRAARENAGRPCLALDELGQYFNQVINDVRSNPRAVKFSPTGNGANDKAAEFYADKTREIEYRSHAQIAYTTAFQNAVERSYGWVRVNTKYRPRSFDQELWIEDIPNPDLVLPDPEALKPDSSDMRYLFYYESWLQSDFKKRFKDARVTSFGDYAAQAPKWIKADTILLAEYWTVEERERELLLLQDPRTGQQVTAYADELDKMPQGAVVLKRRIDKVPRVQSQLTNGVELLGDPQPWAGKFIPFASCLGKVIYVDEGSGSKRKILSMTRLARDPYMLYCYYRTCEAELVGMTPKTPYIGYKGQFRGMETEWQAIAHEPKAYLEANPLTEATGSQILPLPQRQPYDPPIGPLEVGAEAARRAIQSAMGSSPLPTQAQRKNEKSGVALRQIEQTAQKGTYHFIDHYDDMIRHVGVMLEDLIPKIHDVPQETGIRKADETSAIVRINDPDATDQKGQPAPIDTKGDYLVTVSTGPNFESEREQGSEFADTLVQTPLVAQVAGPEAAAKVLALAIRLKNLGPIGDQMADVISPAPSEDGAPNPAQLQQQLEQAQQMLQQASQQLQEKEQIIEADTIKSQAQIQIETLRLEAAKVTAGARGMVQIEQTQSTNQAKLDQTALQGQIDQMLEELKFLHARALQDDAQRHQAMQAEMDEKQESPEAD